MADHPNAEIFRNLFDAMNRGDAEAVKALLAEDLRWHEAGNPDVIVGRDNVAKRFEGIGQLAANEVSLHDVLANDEHVVAMLNVSLAKGDGSKVAYQAVEIAHVDNGVITERWAFMDAVPADVAAFFADLG